MPRAYAKVGLSTLAKGANHVVDDLCDTLGAMGGRTGLFLHAGRLHSSSIDHRIGGSLD